MNINPDCSNYTDPNNLVVNGQLPGTTLEATQGQVLRVTVYNRLPKSTQPDATIVSYLGGNTNAMTIHFHGILQLHSNDADGVPFVTQNPILPGDHYVYEFYCDQAGTYFYHAHVGMQERSVIGAIIVRDPNEKLSRRGMDDKKGQKIATLPAYDDERLIVLSEWYHLPRLAMEEYLLGPTFAGLLIPNSILINGRTVYAENATTKDCPGYEVVPVQRGLTYRIRVVGANLFTTSGFAIAKHQMTVFETDGTLVKPYDVDYLEVAPGQRYSVLVTADQDPSKTYAIGTEMMWTDAGVVQTNGWGLLQYQAGDSEDASMSGDGDEKTKDDASDAPAVLVYPLSTRQDITLSSTDRLYWDWRQMAPLFATKQDRNILAGSADRTIYWELGSTTLPQLPAGNFRYAINGVPFMDPTETLLLQALNSTRPQSSMTAQQLAASNGYDASLGTYPLKNNEVVDIVIQNVRETNTPCRAHPFHTHGHTHWWIASGSGKYDPETDGQVRNIPNPVAKDTTLLYADPSPDAAADDLYCGWMRLRLFADNPGYWAAHCHIVPHMFMGMMIAFEESPELIPSYLSEIINCGH
ncbi:Cupredoxin [Hesseltinella vesiculosa]|uniref:Cupredoxin n=1 Tax=Hesseltinella vesiculosa TaxID=101127 RepID=A0A1X2GGU5_9FUNG|nr:Cupredoxin [Hesseltinella vesiculosa]